MTDAELLDYCRRLYDEHGPEALGFRFLKAHRYIYWALYARGIKQKDLLARLGLEEEFQAHKMGTPIVRKGREIVRWTWDRIVAEAAAVKETQGFLPTAGWFRDNGHQTLVQMVYYVGRNWEDLRRELGEPAVGHFVESRNGVRWRSHPEASLSNFLYARGIPHRTGDRYPTDYAEQSGRTYGYYDLHFAAGDRWIDVEVWGDNPRGTEADYRDKRASKEAFNAGNANFLGIHFEDCQREERLAEVLAPYIGIIEPYVFDRPTDPVIPSTHWSNTDEMLVYCRKLAAEMPDGLFPSEGWLRKRGKYAGRPGEAHNTLAVYIKLWFGGVRNLRKILGQEHASTRLWDRDSALEAWARFWRTHGLTPGQVRAQVRQGKARFGVEVEREAGRLTTAVAKHAGGAPAANAALGIEVDRKRGPYRTKRTAG